MAPPRGAPDDPPLIPPTEARHPEDPPLPRLSVPHLLEGLSDLWDTEGNVTDEHQGPLRSDGCRNREAPCEWEVRELRTGTSA